ncbi:two component, sigma54 specific, transcriptional regulator, Fis family [Pirellula staleyi DSM 6068]|uniref:Two component, sigma54 specific, transcriptional regulator, Fis family n=1 Tax=Pirellula staleyi (strain ATCC 27377 / DSM 6068 / ICPB 4128) TaxID=530564 RepID=D2QY56_PIRSD|nr:sigma-54 dependent transcriptional regulator [Pirellula staleyi]ADB16270.1 two component, sigma54 specific, transcriptional regulator, Fis family [Pirellula staleyi DSM 6068]
MADYTHIDLLVVDDDQEFRETVVKRLSRSGFRLQDAPTAEAALELAERRDFDVAVFDMQMPGMSGLDLLAAFKTKHPDCEVILLTGQGSIESAVEAMRMGAFDYLTKPFPLRDLEVRIEKAYDRHLLRKENQQLKTILARSAPGSTMIGKSVAMQELQRLIQRAGPSEKAILIQGESGTGKELVARALHAASSRADRPMVVINCAALPEPLLESELFGHEKGAFTGAVAAKPGLFEVADGSTLFIDEIGEMPGSLQAKLLRVLEDGSLRRIGSLQERRVNVRILAATNRSMQDEVTAGNFREDLYYRINVMSLELPPLRSRTADIPLLVEHFLGKDWRIEPTALSALEQYAWPGNVRQLINAIERAKIMADGRTIRANDLPTEVLHALPQIELPPSLDDIDDLSAIQRQKIVEVLKREKGNKSRAARMLGIDRRKLYRLLEKFTIETGETQLGRPPVEKHNGAASLAPSGGGEVPAVQASSNC